MLRPGGECCLPLILARAAATWPNAQTSARQSTMVRSMPMESHMPKSVVNRVIAALSACVTALAVATLLAFWLDPPPATAIAATAPASQAPRTTGRPPARATTMLGLQQQMAAMQHIHDRVVQARDADARRALMPEHMIAMQIGMAMLEARPPADADADADAQAGDPVARPMYADLPARTAVEPLQVELQLMQLLIQMMIDRLPPA